MLPALASLYTLVALSELTALSVLESLYALAALSELTELSALTALSALAALSELTALSALAALFDGHVCEMLQSFLRIVFHFIGEHHAGIVANFCSPSANNFYQNWQHIYLNLILRYISTYH